VGIVVSRFTTADYVPYERKSYIFAPNSDDVFCLATGPSTDLTTIHSAFWMDSASTYMILTTTLSDGSYSYQTVTNQIIGSLEDDIQVGGHYSASEDMFRFSGTTKLVNGVTYSKKTGFLFSLDDS
jgi:hypothetical protein